MTAREVIQIQSTSLLGAMLYEILAGRRHFIGEGALAVIGQHINTPHMKNLTEEVDGLLRPR